jgi:hypothetical protein
MWNTIPWDVTHIFPNFIYPYQYPESPYTFLPALHGLYYYQFWVSVFSIVVFANSLEDFAFLQLYIK